MRKLATLFSDSYHEFKQVRTVTTSAMFAAISVVLGYFTIVIGDYIKIGFSTIPSQFVYYLSLIHIYPRDIQVPGRDANGIFFAVDFLKATTKSLLNSGLEDGAFISAKGKHVIVIGGGDTGNDCVGTSIRHGCASVTQLEMMPKLPDKRTEDNTWPEWPRICKTDYGQEESIAVFGRDPRIYQTTVKEFIKDKDGNVTKAVLISLKSQKDPETGRMMMVPVEGTEREVPADLVLIAAGFLGAQKYVADAFGVELNARTNVVTEAGKYGTNIEKVFVTGDMHRGQSLVVWAIREGREVAKEVDKSLIGYSNLA